MLYTTFLYGLLNHNIFEKSVFACKQLVLHSYATIKVNIRAKGGRGSGGHGRHEV